MQFGSLILVSNGIVRASAKGHPDEVVRAFREVCQILLGGTGPWRITKVQGECPDDVFMDSSMEWYLEAKVKTQAAKRRVIL